MRSRLFFLKTACVVLPAIILISGTLLAQRPGGFGGGSGGQDKRLLDQFDRDNDGMLNLQERDAARASMPTPRGGFGRGFGGNGIAPSSQGIALSQTDVESFSEESLYDESVLRTIFMEFESADWEAELVAFNDSDVEVAARVSVDGTIYEDVGVHFRGASSFMFAPDGSKRSLNLSFNFIDSDQRLLSYRTVNLLNATNDPTFLRAVYYSHIARQYIPAPRINFVRVVINDENWGIYLNAQQFNSDFARDWFDSKSGARWKVPGSPFGRAGLEYLGDNIDRYRSLYEIRSSDKEQSWLDFIEMTRVLNETPADQLVAELSPLLDIDGALRFLALDLALVNTDGYWTRASDYSIYQDEQGQFHIIPHDINEVMMDEGGGFGFGNGPRATVNLDPLAILRDTRKPLHSRLLAVPELRERYLGYVKDIAENWLDWEQAQPLLQGYQNLIRADVERDTRKLYSTTRFETEFNSSAESLKDFIEERQHNLLNMLP